MNPTAMEELFREKDSLEIPDSVPSFGFGPWKDLHMPPGGQKGWHSGWLLTVCWVGLSLQGSKIAEIRIEREVQRNMMWFIHIPNPKDECVHYVSKMF